MPIVLGASYSFSYLNFATQEVINVTVTEEMLPDEMSLEEKRALIDGAKRRLERSKWMIMLIIGFISTFAVEAVLLFVLPWIEGMIG